MTFRETEHCKVLLENIDRAMQSLAAARLSDAKYADVEKLRQQIRKLCSIGNDDEAERMEKLAISIIHEGSSVSE